MSIADFPYRPARAAWGANRLVDVGGAGLAVPDTGSGNAFSRNRVSRCAGPGILLRGHMNRLGRDRVAKGGGERLVLGGSGGHVATRVKLAKVTGDGAAVTAGDNLVEGVTVVRPAGFGFSIEGEEADGNTVRS